MKFPHSIREIITFLKTKREFNYTSMIPLSKNLYPHSAPPKAKKKE